HDVAAGDRYTSDHVPGGGVQPDVVVVEAGVGVGAFRRPPVDAVRLPELVVQHIGDQCGDAVVELLEGAEGLDRGPGPVRGGGYLVVGDTEGFQDAGRGEQDRRVDGGGFQFGDRPAQCRDGFVEPSAAGVQDGPIELGPGPAGPVSGPLQRG